MVLRFLRIAFITDPLLALCLFLTGVITLVLSLGDSEGKLHWKVGRLCARVMLFVSGVKVEVAGLGRIPQKGSFVIVSNHLSLLDTPVVVDCLPVTFRFLAKESLTRVPLIGWHLRRGGHIRVARRDPHAGARALAEAERVLRKGTSVFVFAEGSRSSGRLRAFKAGAAYIAVNAGVPLLPVALAGTDKLLPKGSMHIRPGRVQLRVGEPIPTAGLTARDHTALTEQLRARVSELVAETARAATK